MLVGTDLSSCFVFVKNPGVLSVLLYITVCKERGPCDILQTVENFQVVTFFYFKGVTCSNFRNVIREKKKETHTAKFCLPEIRPLVGMLLRAPWVLLVHCCIHSEEREVWHMLQEQISVK